MLGGVGNQFRKQIQAPDLRTLFKKLEFHKLSAWFLG